MGDVVDLNRVRSGEIPAEQVLKEAIPFNLNNVVVIGWTQDDRLFLDTSTPNNLEILWLLEKAKCDVFDIANINVR